MKHNLYFCGDGDGSGPILESLGVRENCAACGKKLGLSDGYCTGWHPAFKCDCGYEEHSERATTYKSCPYCGKGKRIHSQ